MSEPREMELFEKHELDQALRIARETTFEQRFEWLEKSIELFRQQLRKNYERQKKAGFDAATRGFYD